MSDHIIDIMTCIRKALFRERFEKLRLLTALIFLIFFLIFFSYFQNNPAAKQLLLIFAMITFVGIIFFTRDILRFWKPESSALMQQLQKSPKNIVWVYLLKVELIPFGINFKKENTLCLRLLNGDMLQIKIPESDSSTIMEKLELMLPHATFGYNREREQLYGIHPELLLKEKDED